MERVHWTFFHSEPSPIPLELFLFFKILRWRVSAMLYRLKPALALEFAEDCEENSIQWLQRTFPQGWGVLSVHSLMRLHGVVVDPLKVKVSIRPTVIQPISLGVEPHVGSKTRFLLLSDACSFVYVGRPLWREDGFVIYCGNSQAVRDMYIYSFTLHDSTVISQSGSFWICTPYREYTK
jgi:hypothetical protein